MTHSRLTWPRIRGQYGAVPHTDTAPDERSASAPKSPGPAARLCSTKPTRHQDANFEQAKTSPTPVRDELSQKSELTYRL